MVGNGEWSKAAAELEALRTLRPASVPGEIPRADYERPLNEFLIRWAEERPHTTAIHFYGRDIDYAELEELVAAAAGWLRGQGVAAGDRVGVFMSNCPQFIIALLAILRLGAVHLPINPMFQARELAHELRDATPRVVIAQAEFQPLIERVLADPEAGVDADLTVAYTQLADTLTGPAVPAAPFAAASGDLPSDWADIVSHSPAAPAEVDPTALAVLNYTGGTTGLPKGCEHTQAHMVYSGLKSHAGRGHVPGTDAEPEVILGFQPIFWIAGEDFAILSPLVDGSTLVLMSRWHPGVALELIAAQRVSTLSGLGDSYWELLEEPGCTAQTLESLRDCTAISFVRKLDRDLRTAWREVSGTTLREASYGMTETHTADTSTLGLQDGDMDLAKEPVYCGFPVPGTRIVVVDADLNPVPVGESGQIIVSSPSVMTGYYRRPEATRDSLVDGWLLTGDTGRFDEHGALTYLARTKEMIKVNGMSVFPAEVETLLKAHPAIETVAVAPRADERKGQVPVAFTILTAGSAATAEELHTWALEQMARYKVPEFVFVEAMPMTATGKIRKVELLESLEK
ncbi:AMP-binding protein [Brevibacterium sp. 91QC2O2]|uniref:AMP-binding protein n=1 Tax=Brevibacterium sp. 91QC2O2 TaxID=2968458 RepID=UPI00211BAEA0|nr:AMP-binding protein [Brevibacterium sp. 91QC2O2]MCQ9368989.1 AMP-binding protein [Brevibacterium sp. 91QC2O2]